MIRNTYRIPGYCLLFLFIVLYVYKVDIISMHVSHYNWVAGKGYEKARLDGYTDIFFDPVYMHRF